MIDTSLVQGRRTLRFETLDALLADARRCAGGGRVGRLGNWTVGQALNHVAAWIDYPLLGYPPELVIPEAMKAGAAEAKGRIMREAMLPGERLPGLEAGTLAIEEVPAAVGLARLEDAVARLRAGDPDEPTPVVDPYFGRMTRSEWTEMSLRHAELHFSFFVVR